VPTSDKHESILDEESNEGNEMFEGTSLESDDEEKEDAYEL
jgi:hypothetical protein